MASEAYTLQTGASVTKDTLGLGTTDNVQFAKLGVGDPADASRILLVEGDVSGGVATIERTNASTNGILGTMIVKGTSTGNMADGFGTAFQFAIEDDAGTENLIANIQGVRNGADNSGKIVFATYNAGVAYVGMTIDTLGKITIGDSALQTPENINAIKGSRNAQLSLMVNL